MAGEGERMEKSVEELEKEITCAICHEHYTEPKVLPCMHYYCKDCIHALALRKGIDKPFSCPECRTDITLPQGDIASLKPAFFINRMKEVHSKLSRAHGKVEAMCESCSGDKAVAFCRQCTQFICAECVKQHKRMNTFAGHKTVSLEELKEGVAKDMVEEAPLRMCPEHDEQMKIYCFDCNCLICRDCTVKDHIGHNHEFVKKAAPKIKKELLEQLFPLKEVKMRLSRAIDEIQTTKSEVEAQVDTVTARVQCLFEELQQILAHRKQQLIKEAIAKGGEKLEHLAGQEKELSASCAVAQSVIDYTEQCIEHSADDEVMCMHAEIQRQIQGEIAEQKCNDLYPVEEADIGVEVSCVEDLKQLCQTKAKLTQLDTEITVAGEGMNSAEVGKVSKFGVITKLGDGQQMKRKVSLECHLKSLADGSTTKCEVDRTSNEHRIQYTPTVRGRHEIIVTAPGLEIAGSPFPVFVSIHPTQLVKPVRVITGIEPLHVAINSAGDVVVTELNNVAIFNREGKKVTSIKSNEVRGINSFGLAVDSDDIVYISHRVNGSSYIIKLTSKLKLINMSRKFDTGFRDISIVGGEIMVCNKNDCSIMVFTRALEFVKKLNIHKKSSGRLRNIHSVSSDNRGNLYVCGGESLIHVFTASGRFLRSFSGRKLTSTRGICVAGGYVYVTDYAINDVLAYTTEGEYVASLNQCTNCDFNRPFGMCADKDGFVYICDSENKRIVIF